MGQDSLLGSFEELVLLAVGRGGGEAYGMTVRREIEEQTDRDVAIGAVYATLDRLEAKGLVVSRVGDPGAERRGRARRYFRLLPSGVEALAAAQATRAGLWEGVSLSELAAEAEAGS